MVSREQLLRIMPFSAKRVPTFLDPLNDAMREFEIDNGPREAAFLAQIAHESGELRYVVELASGEAYDTGRLAEKLGNTPEDDDDGRKYKGRGLIQITGQANYLACGLALGIDLIANPVKLEEPVYACRSAGWYWKEHGLNELADGRNFLLITRRINGGTNGWAARMKYYQRALDVIGE